MGYMPSMHHQLDKASKGDSDAWGGTEDSITESSLDSDSNFTSKGVI